MGKNNSDFSFRTKQSGYKTSSAKPTQTSKPSGTKKPNPNYTPPASVKVDNKNGS